MIEIKLAHLRSPSFSMAFQKLMGAQGLEPKSAYHIARVGSLLETELNAANVEHDKLIKQWAEIKNEDGKAMWQVPEEKQADWIEANKNFHEALVKVDKRKILLSEVAQAGLTPVDFLALEPVLTGFEVVEGGENG